MTVTAIPRFARVMAREPHHVAEESVGRDVFLGRGSGGISGDIAEIHPAVWRDACRLERQLAWWKTKGAGKEDDSKGTGLSLASVIFPLLAGMRERENRLRAKVLL